MDRTIASPAAPHQTRRRFLLAGLGAFSILAAPDGLRAIGRLVSDIGGSARKPDSTLILAHIKDNRLCVRCIGAKTLVPSARVAAVLTRAQATVRLAEEGATCDGCSRNLTVYGLGWQRQRLPG